jgi:hypothetical protein
MDLAGGRRSPAMTAAGKKLVVAGAVLGHTLRDLKPSDKYLCRGGFRGCVATLPMTG